MQLECESMDCHTGWKPELFLIICLNVKTKQSQYRPEQALRFPEG
jgi:hypothetical protein